MKLKYYKITLVLLALPFLFTSCELLGLDYQDSYDYDYDAGMPSNKIDMSGSCPAPYQINFSVFGHSQNNSISYQPLCDALEMLKPIFVGAGALSSMFILMGYSRPNSTGVND